MRGHRGRAGGPHPVEVDGAIRKLLADARPHTNFADMSSQNRKG